MIDTVSTVGKTSLVNDETTTGSVLANGVAVLKNRVSNCAP